MVCRQLLAWAVLAAFVPAAHGEPPARLDGHGDPLPPGALWRAGTVRLRHAGAVAAVAFSPDGKTVASASWDRTVRLWDAVTGKLLHQLNGHQDAVFCVAFAPDGQTLASAGKDRTVRLWDAATGREVSRIEHAEEVDCLAFAPDGKAVATAGRFQTIRLWEVPSGRELRRFDVPTQPKLVIGHVAEANLSGLKRPLYGVLALAFAPDGKTLAAGHADQAIRLWNVAADREPRRLNGHSKPITSLAFSADGMTLLSGSADDTSRLWDVAAGRELRRHHSHQSAVLAVALSPDGKTAVVVNQYDTLRLWETATGKELGAFRTGDHTGFAVAFSPDGTTLATAGYGQRVSLWHVPRPTAGEPPRTSLEPRRPSLHQPGVSPLAFSPDGRLLAAVRRDGALCLCEAATGREVRALADHPRGAMVAAFTPDGKTVATVTWDGEGRLAVSDMATGKRLGDLPAPHTMTVGVAADGKTLALAGHDRTLVRWDLATGRELHRGKHQAYLHAAFSPSGRLFAEARYEGTIHLWDLWSGKELRRVSTGKEGGIYSPAFSPDGRVLAWGGDDASVHLCEVATGQERSSIRGPRGCVQALAFTRDGKTLASGGGERIHSFGEPQDWRFQPQPLLSDYSVCLWDVGTGQSLRRLRGHQGSVYALAFGGDGRTLLSRSWDGTALVWDLTQGTREAEPPRVKLTPKELEDAWAGLSDRDAAAAYRQMGRLRAAPDQAVAILRQHLRPVPAVDAARLARLLDGLDSDDFKDREQAVRELRLLGESVEGDLRRLRENSPSLEVRRRAEQLLQDLDATVLPPERLRALRGLEVLEQIGTPGARRVLQELAKGATGSWLTQDAHDVLKRLAQD